MSGVIDEMGCRAENEDGLLCTTLILEERRLELEILTADRKWHEQEAKKNGAKAEGNGGNVQKGWVAEAVEAMNGWVLAEAAEVMNAGP